MPGTRKLGKTTDQRMAMLRQQVTDFLDKGRMETTITRAKEIKPMAEKMITLGKKGVCLSTSGCGGKFLELSRNLRLASVKKTPFPTASARGKGVFTA